jgi:hypothetical protein
MKHDSKREAALLEAARQLSGWQARAAIYRQKIRSLASSERPGDENAGPEYAGFDTQLFLKEYANHIPVVIQRPDGTTYVAYFNGYYDMRPTVPEFIPSIAIYRADVGGLSHGMLPFDDQIIAGEIPSPEAWQKSQLDLAAAADASGY